MISIKQKVLFICLLLASSLSFTQIGLAQIGDLRVSEDDIDFGEIEIDDSESERVLLRWTGQSALWVEYDEDLPFDMELDNDCPILLTPGMVCELEFEFSPQELADYSGELIIRSRDGRELVEIKVIGTGIREEK